jgi:hypothetical protein
VILSAKFQLMEISSTQLRQVTVRVNDLEGLFRAFDENRHWPYAVAWVDGTSEQGRGAVFFAEHLEGENVGESLAYAEKPIRKIPFFAPSWLLNSLTIKVYNELFYWKYRPGEALVDLESCFFPLDKIQNWNRLYGRRGFIQYQFCLPEERSFEGIRQVLETIRRSRETPFLTVLKRHGERPPEALNSFPIRGFSLALDFPRTKKVFHLVEKLDELVWGLGGKVYLAKDACSAPRMGRVNPAAFGEEKFFSLLKKRLLGADKMVL